MIVGYDSTKNRYFMIDLTEEDAKKICVICQSIEVISQAFDEISPEINIEAQASGLFPAETKMFGLRISGMLRDALGFKDKTENAT